MPDVAAGGEGADFRSASDADKESINDDIVFEIELIKQVEINVDYILMLVERYLKAKGTGTDKEVRAAIDRAVGSSPSLRNKKDLIEQFVESVSASAKVGRRAPPAPLFVRCQRMLPDVSGRPAICRCRNSRIFRRANPRW